MTKILIVDDDACNRDILKTRLEQSRYEVAEAQNGEEGVRLAREIRPDLIILDVMMPKVDGWLACRILKSDELTKNIPIVMLTACSQQIEEMRGWEAGADAYLSKPCDHPRLLAAVSELLARVPQGK